MRSAQQTTVRGSVDADLSAYLASIIGSDKTPNLTEVFHSVRRLPYLSSSDRSLETILKTGKGSCSSKHILLATLLNKLGIKAEVELVLGDFGSPLEAARDIPDTLLKFSQQGIRDVHNVVRAWIEGQPVILDATWHDAVIPHGFRVNHHWEGAGDTVIAVDVEKFLGPALDVAAAKEKIISSWPATEQIRRRHFLDMINTWVAGLEGAAPAKH